MQTASERSRLDLLYELSCAFTARTEIDELVPLIADKCREVLDAGGVSVLLLDSERGELYFPYVAETDPEAARRLLSFRMPLDKGISGHVVETGRALRLDDGASDPRFFRLADEQSGVQTGPLLAAPLMSYRGPVGVIQAVRRQGGRPFTDDDLQFLEALAGSVAVALENARLYERLKASEAGLRAELGAFRRDNARRDGFDHIVTQAESMRDVLDLMASAAASPISVLIQGDTGTGKELVARGIHQASPRASGPFVAVNCAALPESLLESELFGHRRGSFTGALQDHRGMFEAASHGTIFLDEVGEMPLVMQAKLLRVLQEGEIVPVGDTRPRKVDVRVVSATNRDLEQEVERGTIRADLFYRLAAFPIPLPPLRDRREDIPLLVSHFLAKAAARQGKEIAGIDPSAVELLACARWPGNVRQLENELERAVTLVRSGDVIGPVHLSARVRQASSVGASDAAVEVGARLHDAPCAAEAQTEAGRLPSLPGHDGSTAAGPASSNEASLPSVEDPLDLRAARAAFERAHLEKALRAHAWNVTRAARALGLSRAMLQNKMKNYDLR